MVVIMVLWCDLVDMMVWYMVFYIFMNDSGFDVFVVMFFISVFLGWMVEKLYLMLLFCCMVSVVFLSMLKMLFIEFGIVFIMK